MKKYKFNVTGKERKSLVSAMSEILQSPAKYLGAPGFQYQVGNYIIDKNGTVTGEHDQHLFAALAECDFVPEFPIETDINRLTIEVPLEGFTPEHIANLNKMVLSKEPLLKKALGVDELPICMGTDTIKFPWFPIEPTENAAYYVQFIYALCETAKAKKRVNAKAQENFENEKFALRVWLIGLGLIGKEYGKIRKLMMANMSGDSSWRFGKPEKAAEEGVTAPETAPADDAPADAAPEEEAATTAAENAVEEAGSDD